MTDLRKAAEMAFNAAKPAMKAAIEKIKELQAENKALRQALAQPEQEPVAWVKEEWFTDDVGLQNTREVLYGYEVYGGKPLYTAPPKREWVGLTDEEIEEYKWMGQDVIAVIKEVQATLKEKNT